MDAGKRGEQLCYGCALTGGVVAITHTHRSGEAASVPRSSRLGPNPRDSVDARGLVSALQGEDVNEQGMGGVTALHVTAAKGRVKAAKTLVKNNKAPRSRGAKTAPWSRDAAEEDHSPGPGRRRSRRRHSDSV